MVGWHSSLKTAIPARFRRSLSSRTKPESFAFSGCGWLSPYYFGVLQCLKENGYLSTGTKFAGTSGGALAAIVGFCDIDTKEALESMISISQTGGHHLDIDSILREKTLHLLRKNYVNDNQDEEKFLREVNDGQGRLSLCVTRVWPKPSTEPIMIKSFNSFKDLADVAAASCFIPVWSKLARLSTTTTIFARDEEKSMKEVSNEHTVVDGGFTAFMPPGCEVCVSPFPREYILRSMRKPHICLERGDISLPQLLYWVLNPAPPVQLRGFYDMGYKSAEIFIEAREQ